TGKPFSTLEGLRAMKNGFQWAGLYALGAIVAVLLADFRSLRHTLVALAPLAMGMTLTLGVMGVCGWPLNPANMIAFPLIVGVGEVRLMQGYGSTTRASVSSPRASVPGRCSGDNRERRRCRGSVCLHKSAGG